MRDATTSEVVPLVTVVVAAYNAANTITETVGSVTAQTRGEWELVIVDDGSTDATYEKVASAASPDPRIRVLRQANAGTARARNAGACLATGEFLVFLDADDLLLPDYMENQLAFATEHPGYDVYACNACLLLPDGRRRTFWNDARHARVFSLDARDQIHESSILLMSMITRRTFELAGGFRTLHSEDYDFWLRALLSGARHIYNPAVLAVYRRHRGQRTRSLMAEAESFLWILRDNAERPDLDDAANSAFAEAIVVAEMRLNRRGLEEALLEGRFEGARRTYWRCRAAFPNRAQYWLGYTIMLLSPRLYAAIKSARMI